MLRPIAATRLWPLAAASLRNGAPAAIRHAVIRQRRLATAACMLPAVMKPRQVLPVAIVGAAAVRVDSWSRKGEVSELELLTQVVEEALADAGIDACEVGALSFTMTGRGTRQLCFSSYATARLGLRNVGKVVENASGGWTGGLAFDAAAHEIRAGRTRFALALGVHMESAVPTPTVMDEAIRATGDVGFHSLYGTTPLSWYALDAARWMHEHAVSRSELAAIALKNRGHAAANPLAQSAQPLTLADVLAAPPVVDPFGLHEVSRRGDGAACLVLAERAAAQTVAARYSQVAGIGFHHDGNFQVDGVPGPVTHYGALARAADKAMTEAGSCLRDIDLFELYAPVTVVEAISVETLGLAPPGAGARVALEGQTARGGRTPVSVSGGCLSRGHPPPLTALYDLLELHLQLTGNAGARQLPGARRGLASCETGKFNGAMVTILEAP